MPNLAGIFDLTKSKSEIQTVVERQAERIDVRRVKFDRYTWCDDGFGATLLDRGIFENGPQPVFSHDRRFVLWLDGDVSNSEELKIAHRNKWQSSIPPDTTAEMCLQLLMQRGNTAVLEFRGLFIIVLYDRELRKLTVFSGRYGYRPLFYKYANGQFLFGTEVKAIRAADDAPATYDETALLEQYVYGVHFADRMWLRDHQRIRPSTILTVDESGLNTFTYWQYKYNESAPRHDLHTNSTVFGVLLDRAVDRAMRGNMRKGIFLSGGYDSRSVAAAIRPWHLPIPSFTFGVPESRDVIYAGMMAKRLGFQHFALSTPGAYLYKNAPGVIWRTEGLIPFSNVTSLHYHPLFRQHFDIVLTGLLGEFSGSHTWRELLMARTRQGARDAIFNRHIAPKLPMAKRLFTPQCFERAFSELVERFDESVNRVWNDHPLDIADVWAFENTQPMGSWQAPGVDRYLFENRAPHLDYDLVDFLLGIRPMDRLEQRVYKQMIATTYPSIRDVPCTNSGKPIDPNFAREYAKLVARYAGRKLRDKTNDLLRRRPALDREFRRVDEDFRAEPELVTEILQPALRDGIFPPEIFQIKAIEQLIDEHYNKNARHEMMLARLISFALGSRYLVHNQWREIYDELNVWPEESGTEAIARTQS
ncbi:MAG TPA: asparagine synthase-related protein [Terriglobales bacterium]|nr:asparagine synthase-related protein [Terriglobales bacterium]